MLSIEGLKVSYGHVEALKGIDLEVRQGEYHGDHRFERRRKDFDADGDFGARTDHRGRYSL